VLGLAAASFTIGGPGPFSLDALTGHVLDRPWMRAAALAVIPAAIGVQLYRRRKALASDTVAPASGTRWKKAEPSRQPTHSATETIREENTRTRPCCGATGRQLIPCRAARLPLRSIGEQQTRCTWWFAGRPSSLVVGQVDRRFAPLIKRWKPRVLQGMGPEVKATVAGACFGEKLSSVPGGS
jgi:hypothetical protein